MELIVSEIDSIKKANDYIASVDKRKYISYSFLRNKKLLEEIKREAYRVVPVCSILALLNIDQKQVSDILTHYTEFTNSILQGEFLRLENERLKLSKTTDGKELEIALIKYKLFIDSFNQYSLTSRINRVSIKRDEKKALEDISDDSSKFSKLREEINNIQNNSQNWNRDKFK